MEAVEAFKEAFTEAFVEINNELENKYFEVLISSTEAFKYKTHGSFRDSFRERKLPPRKLLRKLTAYG